MVVLFVALKGFYWSGGDGKGFKGERDNKQDKKSMGSGDWKSNWNWDGINKYSYIAVSSPHHQNQQKTVWCNCLSSKF